eukprot:CAMPEP_0179345018 /NCGR_PEP_ID=MMETSP0797-20121207/71816_1 /TAXON_ID=47934 /ORGANISM="Dinophysis acuminata, Strain DAEP01" /LENGTH=136 /DNA_ID=CAMNT_0021059471 /DNA_START=140 /DNA_END=549 /DNA_ORIENTATION=-
MLGACQQGDRPMVKQRAHQNSAAYVKFHDCDVGGTTVDGRCEAGRNRQQIVHVVVDASFAKHVCVLAALMVQADMIELVPPMGHARALLPDGLRADQLQEFSAAPPSKRGEDAQDSRQPRNATTPPAAAGRAGSCT